MTSLLFRDPFLAAPFRLMDQLLGAGGNGNRVTGWTPPLDVRETEDDYLVMLDLPGVKSQDVTIEVDGQVLSISGSRVPVETGEGQLAERPFGSFFRTLNLPKGVDSETIVADYHDGVLELRVPKPVGVKPKRIAIGGVSDQKAIES